MEFSLAFPMEFILPLREALKKWCEDISKETNTQWKSLKVSQVAFDRLKSTIRNFSDLVSKLTTEESSQGMFNIEK